MNITQFKIFLILFESLRQDKNHETTISCDEIRSELNVVHGITIGRCWTYECLKWLVDNEYIKRWQRFSFDDKGHPRLDSSGILIAPKGKRFLITCGVERAKIL